MNRFPLFWQWNSDKLKKIKTALSSEIFSAMYRPEIGPGSIAWLATILPLNQRCLIYSIYRFNKVLLFNPIFSSKLWTKSWKLCFSLIEVLSSAEYFDSFLFFDSETVKNENIQVCAFPAKFFALLLCIGRESKPGLSRGRRQFYHWTTDAWFKML